MQRIEAARAQLEASLEEVEIVDYGAGPDGTRTSEEMVRGVRVRRAVAEVCRSSSKPPAAAALLFDLVRRRRPEKCLELGTCLGISAAYQAAALTLNKRGSLITLEGAPALAERAGKVLDELGLAERVDVRVGRFRDLLPAAVGAGPFDLAFVDGHHDEAATLEYFREIAPVISSNGMMVFDDIGWSKGMQAAWRTIRSDQAIASSRQQAGFGLVVLK